MQSKSQRFSTIVFPHVEDIAGSGQAAKYKTLCKKAGSLIRNSGLMQTLAFFKARGQKPGEGHHLVLMEHLQQEMRALNLIGPGENIDQVVQASPLPHYMVLTRESLYLLNWHKRLCETLIQSDATVETGPSEEGEQ